MEAHAATHLRAAARTERRRAALVLAAGRIAVILLVVIGWEIASMRTTLVPSVSVTLSTLAEGFTEGWIRAPLWDSLLAIGAGFAIALALALPVGIVLARSRFLGAVFDPIIAGMFAIPRIILFPVILAIFSVGLQSKIAIAVISAFFPIALSTTAALRSVSPTLLKLGRATMCSPLQMVRKIYLPAAAPAVMVGVRIGFGIAFVSVIISELFAASEGLGLLVQRSSGLQQFDQMFAVVLLIFVIAFAGNLLLWYLERRMRSKLT